MSLALSHYSRDVADTRLPRPWILVAIVLFAMVAVVGVALYASAVRRQRAEAARDPTSAGYRSVARRANLFGLLTLAVVAVVLLLMVIKPGF